MVVVEGDSETSGTTAERKCGCGLWVWLMGVISHGRSKHV